MDLGRLERVDLRSIWLSEPQGFTPWLAREENLALLGEALGVELELEAQEREVGPFRADILCKNTMDDSWVLIENQLERTDHIHLGQLLTYAAGLDAVTVVWIAGTFTEEHRAALDWLNRITADNFRFFGLEIELWRIGASPCAPKFNLIAKPNDWSQAVGRAARGIASGEAEGRQKEYARYWAAFGEYLSSRGSRFRVRAPQHSHWISFGMGRGGFHLSTAAGWRDKWIAVQLTIRDEPGKPFYHLLLAQRPEIEAELGFELEWYELPSHQRARIEVRKAGLDPFSEIDWVQQHNWLADKLEALDRVLRPRIAGLNADDWSPEDEVRMDAGAA